MKWSFGLLALLLVSTTAKAQAVEAVIDNNLGCDIKVRIYGRIGNTCGVPFICYKEFTVTNGGSLTVLPGDMPCNVDEFMGAQVRSDCSNAGATVEKVGGCFLNPQSDSFTLTGTCSVSCNATTVNVDLTSGSYDITVDVY